MITDDLEPRKARGSRRAASSGLAVAGRLKAVQPQLRRTLQPGEIAVLQPTVGARALERPAGFLVGGADRRGHPGATDAPAGGVITLELGLECRGRARGLDSEGRWRSLRASATQSDMGQGFGWLRPPVLNRLTRLAAVMNAATGALSAIGLEARGTTAVPVTKTLRIDMPAPLKK